MKLTVEQRAQRRASRINNKLKREFPLLAEGGVIDDWMTTPEAEIEVVKQQDVNAEKWRKAFEKHKKELEEEAQKTRLKVAEMVSPETLEKLDEVRNVWSPDAEYSASFWNTVWARFNGDQRGYLGEEVEELLKKEVTYG